MSSCRIWSVLLLSLPLFIFAGHSNAGTETWKIIMPWDGDVTIHSIGEDKMVFLGSFKGIMYAESAKGKLDSAFASCPAKQIINTKTGEGSASGHCEITVGKNSTAYAEWSCKGKVGNCKGKFTITGGRGKLKGATGSSDFVVRSVLNVLAKGVGNGAVIRSGSGIAILNKLTIKTPK